MFKNRIGHKIYDIGLKHYHPKSFVNDKKPTQGSKNIKKILSNMSLKISKIKNIYMENKMHTLG